MPNFADPKAPIDYGRDFNFYTKMNVTSAGFATDCDLVITFPTYTVTFNLETSSVVQYSFNGTTIHGELNSAQTSKDLKFESRVISKIWFKLVSGTSPAIVRVEAWGIR